MATVKALPVTTTAQVRQCLLAHSEIALIDVREEAPFAEGHPLFAANFPVLRLEVEVYARIPRRTTPIVVYDDGEGLAEPSVRRLMALGYTKVSLLQGGLGGWKATGGETFIDVNVPSKAFGEFVESVRHTPSLSAEEVKALIDSRADVVVLDARPFEEYHTMNIPGSTNVPGAELALRARELAPNAATRIIVNCAGRTRSIIGAQSLVNAGISNPVAALRNGTIGWTLAGQPLERGQQRRFSDRVDPSQAPDPLVLQTARKLALDAGGKFLTLGEFEILKADSQRTTYLFDVRTPDEYAAGHLHGARSAPGGQLVQETDVYAPVRGARIVLTDTDGVRACMTASWLGQMNWEVFVLEGVEPAALSRTGPWRAPVPDLLDERSAPMVVPAKRLRTWISEADDDTLVLDLGSSARYLREHIPGAWFALRSQLKQVVGKLPKPLRYLVTGDDPAAVALAGADLSTLTDTPVHVLDGGLPGWKQAGYNVEAGGERLASPAIDRYRRPYEGTDNPAAAMQAYLDWEYGLVEQLRKDGTHGFKVL